VIDPYRMMRTDGSAEKPTRPIVHAHGVRGSISTQPAVEDGLDIAIMPRPSINTRNALDLAEYELSAERVLDLRARLRTGDDGFYARSPSPA
jgi:hypothetical protein